MSGEERLGNSGSVRGAQVLHPQKKGWGAPPPEIEDLARIEDRMTFAYFERCNVNRSENAITIVDDEGAVYLPAAALDILMLGPGSTVSHRAMELMGDTGTSVVWVGERGVRMYAFARPLTDSTQMLERQAALVSNRRSRISIARRMYQMRFPGEDVSKATMQQLRGREGARIRRLYSELSEETGVEWNGRDYDPDDFDSSSDVNKALSAANACLYGISHAVIASLGCSAGLGFVHTGHQYSFVYDVADLYKAELSIPIAFKVAAEEPDDIGSETRRRMRDRIYDLEIIDRMVRDIETLLLDDEPLPPFEEDRLGLWDDKLGTVEAGKSYAAPNPEV